MARVTVEDCIVHIPNRFELLLVATQRAKQISSGKPLTIDRNNDKDAVVALREIAEETVDREQLKEDVIQGFLRKPLVDMSEKKLLDNENASGEEVQEAFKDAANQMSDTNTGNEDQPPAGMSFEGEDVQASD